MVIEPIVGTLVALAVALRLYFLRTRGATPRGPNLHARIDALFEPYVGQELPPEVVAALQSQADNLFRDIVTGVGLLPNDWRLLVHMDDVLGPVPRVRGPSGELLHVADFEQRLYDGRIELPST